MTSKQTVARAIVLFLMVVAASSPVAADSLRLGNRFNVKRPPRVRPIPRESVQTSGQPSVPHIDSLVPASAYQGDRLTVTLYYGSAQAAEYRMMVRPSELSPTHEAGADEMGSSRRVPGALLRIGEATSGPLVVGAGFVQAEVEIPQSEPPGPKSVSVVVNDTPRLTLDREFTVLARAQPDWALDAPSVQVSGDGRGLSVSVTVRNAGATPARGAVLRAWRKGGGDTVVGKVGILEPQGSTTPTIGTLSLPAAPDGLSDSVIFEVEGRGDADQANNRAACPFTVNLAPAKTADLEVTGFLPRFERDRKRLTLQVSIRNSGDAPSTQTTTRVAANPPVLQEKRFLTTSLSPGATQELPVQFDDIPDRLWGKPIVLTVEVLPAENETNLTNNRYEQEVALPALDAPSRPNLALSGQEGTFDRDAGSIRFRVTVTNTGDAAAGEARLELSDSTGLLSGGLDVPALGPRESRVCTLLAAVPKSLRGRTVAASLQIQALNRALEYDEADNRAGPVRIPIPAAPFNALPYAVGGGGAAAAVAAWQLLRAMSGRGARTGKSSHKSAEPEARPEAEPGAVKSERGSSGVFREAGAGAAGMVGKKSGDDVYFTVTAPAAVLPRSSIIVSVWAHLDAQRQEVLKRAHEAEPDTKQIAASKGPFALTLDTVLDVRLEIEDCSIDPEKETIRWTGAIANADFSVRVNDRATEGNKAGTAFILCGGLELGRVRFLLKVTRAAASAAPVPTTARLHEKAFASYARKDTDAVLLCVQAIQKARPDLAIFLDKEGIRSGERWSVRLEEEILTSDVLYLFWSVAAAQSEWVSREWRFGLEKKGLDFIDPVPLDSPEQAPHPPELDALQFEDKWRILRVGLGADRTKPA